MRKPLAAIALALALTQPAHANRLPPHDECSASLDFGPFYRRFRDIVAHRDARALIALIPAKGANMEFGGLDRTGFVAVWKLHDGAGSPLWNVLGDVLQGGCRHDGDGYVAPDTDFPLPRDGDPGDDLTAFGKVDLRSAPPPEGKVIAHLDGDHVRLDDPLHNPRGWIAVTVSHGRKGFVPAGKVRGELAYRAVFTETNDHWAFTFFGDGE